MLHDKVLWCSKKSQKYFYGVELYGAMFWVCSWNVTDKKHMEFFVEKLLK